jgi:hypothetical protein
LLVSRAWLAIEVGKRGGTSAATYEERLSVRCKASGGRSGIELHRAVTGSVTSDRMKTIPLTCGPGMAVNRRKERRARRPTASARPARYATRERGWLRAEREKSCGLGQGGRGEGLRAKTEMEASIYLFLLNFSNCILKIVFEIIFFLK